MTTVTHDFFNMCLLQPKSAVSIAYLLQDKPCVLFFVRIRSTLNPPTPMLGWNQPYNGPLWLAKFWGSTIRSICMSGHGRN